VGEERDGTTGEAGASDVAVASGLVGAIRGRDVSLTGAAAAFVVAEGDVSVLNGGCGPVLANGSVTITNGGCGPMIANGDVSIHNGGTQAIVAAGAATIGPRALVGVVASPSVTVAEGGRVLLGTKHAAIAGVIAGATFAVVSGLMKRSAGVRGGQRMDNRDR
jgi:hypothetical protein